MGNVRGMSTSDSPSSPPHEGSSGDASSNAPRFQDAIAQVEAITEQIERGEIGLEDSIDQFEKGMELLKNCREILARTEQRVEDITERLRASNTRSRGDSKAPDDQDATR